MQRIIIYALASLCFFLSKTYAQDNFVQRAKKISDNIEQITKAQKDSLKIEIENLESAFKNRVITKDDFEAKKLERAEYRANRIEELVAIEEEKLSQLVKDKVEGRIPENYYFTDSLVIGKKRKFKITYSNYTDNYDTVKRPRKEYSEKRTTTQFVIAGGLNNVVTDGDFSTLEDSEFGVWSSRFFEWGFTFKTRVLPNSNLLQAKYGLSMMYNNVRPKGGQYFVKEGKETHLVSDNPDVERSRFKNVYLAIPVHLEMDLSKNKTNADGKPVFRTQQSLRLGIGGYAGVRVKSKQVIWEEYKVKQKGDFNASDFLYGLSAYIGYENISLYMKYDLNPMFKNNAIDQNNISFGIRLDLD